MGSLPFLLSDPSVEPMSLRVKESLKLNCPRSRNQNCGPSTLCRLFLYGKAPWEPHVPWKGFLVLKWMNSPVLTEKLNVNHGFPNVPNEVGVLRKAGVSRPELDFNISFHINPWLLGFLSLPTLLASLETQRERGHLEYDIKSLRGHLQKHYYFH